MLWAVATASVSDRQNYTTAEITVISLNTKQIYS